MNNVELTYDGYFTDEKLDELVDYLDSGKKVTIYGEGNKEVRDELLTGIMEMFQGEMKRDKTEENKKANHLRGRVKEDLSIEKGVIVEGTTVKYQFHYIDGELHTSIGYWEDDKDMGEKWEVDVECCKEEIWVGEDAPKYRLHVKDRGGNVKIKTGEYPMERVLSREAKEVLRGKLEEGENILVYGQSGEGCTEFLRWLVLNIPKDKKVVVLGLNSDIVAEYSGIGENVSVIEYDYREDTEELVNRIGADYVVYDELNPKSNNLQNLKEGIVVIGGYKSSNEWESKSRMMGMYKHLGDKKTPEEVIETINKIYPTRIDIKGINKEYLGEVSRNIFTYFEKEKKVKIDTALTTINKEEIKESMKEVDIVRVFIKREEVNKLFDWLIETNGKELQIFKSTPYLKDVCKEKGIKLGDCEYKEFPGEELLGGLVEVRLMVKGKGKVEVNII